MSEGIVIENNTVEGNTAPPIAETPPPETPPAPVAPVDEEAALQQEIDAQTIDLPDGKLVPLSAVTTLREKLKDAKKGSAEADTLRQQLDAAQAQLQAVGPLADAFRAMQQAQQAPPPPAPTGPSPEDQAELEDIARTFDFWKADGTGLDLTKAQKHLDLVDKRAEKRAQQSVAPLVQDTLQARAQHNIARARATTLPGSKETADPTILDGLVSKIAQQPNGLQTLANPEAVKQIWLNAYALSQVKRATTTPPTQATTLPANVPPPVYVERPGGQLPQPRALSVLEKKAAKEAGLTETEYTNMAKDMPWGNR